MTSLRLVTRRTGLLVALSFFVSAAEVAGRYNGAEVNPLTRITIAGPVNTAMGADGRVISFPANWSAREGRDGRAVAIPPGWSVAEGADGRVVAYPSAALWSTRQGRDGRIVAYPAAGLWSNRQGADGRHVVFYGAGYWTVREGADGRAVPYYGAGGWTTRAGRDGRSVPVPTSAMTREGGDGRFVAFPGDFFVREGRDGRVVAAPTGWTFREGSDGRAVAVPPGAATRLGSDGRLVPVLQSGANDLLFADLGLVPWLVDAAAEVPASEQASLWLYFYTNESSDTRLTTGGGSGGGTAPPASGSTPTITTHPQSQTVPIGGTVTLSVAASGSEPLLYMWSKDGVVINGATGPTLTVPNAQPKDSGVYLAGVVNAQGYVISQAAQIRVAAPSSQLSNLSILTMAGAGDSALTVGLVVSGGTKAIVIRGVGPTLASFGVSGALADPRLSLFSNSGAVLAANDDWGGAATMSSAFSQVGAFPLPSSSRDAALFGSLSPGVYTVQVGGAGNEAGLILLEAYDADLVGPGRLVNLSAMTAVKGASTVTIGFAVFGSGPKRVLVRAAGPALVQFGVSGILADPELRLFRGPQVLEANNDWSASATSVFQSVGAFAFPSGSRDSALVVTLEPGTYTVEIRDMLGAGGVVLVELYDVAN